jgi:hypothetical protein
VQDGRSRSISFPYKIQTPGGEAITRVHAQVVGTLNAEFGSIFDPVFALSQDQRARLFSVLEGYAMPNSGILQSFSYTTILPQFGEKIELRF